MRHHPLRTIVLCLGVVACVAAGTTFGIRLRQQAADTTETVAAGSPAASGETPVGGADPSVGAPGQAGAPAGDGAPGQAGQGADEPNDVADRADGEIDEQAPPEGEERPPRRNQPEGEERPPRRNQPEGEERPPRRNQPEIPDLEIEPGMLDWPVVPPPAEDGNGNNGGNAGGNNPPPQQPVPQPLRVALALGPGPIWEKTILPRSCNGQPVPLPTSTYVGVRISESPRQGPYTVTATARAGRTTRNAIVEANDARDWPPRYTVSYGFPYGTVREPTNIEVVVTVTNAQGQRASVTVLGRPNIGHQLFPADYCP